MDALTDLVFKALCVSYVISQTLSCSVVVVMTNHFGFSRDVITDRLLLMCKRARGVNGFGKIRKNTENGTTIYVVLPLSRLFF